MYLLIYESNLNLHDKRCKTQLLKNKWVTISKKKRKKKKRKIGTNGIHKFKVNFFSFHEFIKAALNMSYHAPLFPRDISTHNLKALKFLNQFSALFQSRKTCTHRCFVRNNTCA